MGLTMNIYECFEALEPERNHAYERIVENVQNTNNFHVTKTKEQL